DTDSGQLVQSIPRQDVAEIPGWLAFSPDGRLLFSFGRAGTLRVEEIASKKERLARTFAKFDGQGLAVSRDGEQLAIATSRQLFLWKWRTEGPVNVTGLPRVDGMDFAPDGASLAAITRFPNRLHMLEIQSGRVVSHHDFPDTEKSTVWAPRFTP